MKNEKKKTEEMRKQDINIYSELKCGCFMRALKQNFKGRIFLSHTFLCRSSVENVSLIFDE